jgi:hypothetical protein
VIGLTTWAEVRAISVVVKNPEVEHNVRVQDFERWLDSQGRTPAEGSLKAGYENF